MAARRAITLKLPEELIVDLKAYALREHRSMNSAAEFLLASALEVFRRQRPLFALVDQKVGVGHGEDVVGDLPDDLDPGVLEPNERQPSRAGNRRSAGSGSGGAGGRNPKPRRK